MIADGVVCALDGNGNFEGKKPFVPFYQFRQSLVQSVHAQHPHLQDHEALREKLLSLPDARETVGHGWYWENWLFATDVENTAEEAVDSAEWLNSQFHILAVRYTHKPTGFVFTNYRFRDKKPKQNLPDMTYCSMTGKTNDHTASKNAATIHKEDAK